MTYFVYVRYAKRTAFPSMHQSRPALRASLSPNGRAAAAAEAGSAQLPHLGWKVKHSRRKHRDYRWSALVRAEHKLPNSRQARPATRFGLQSARVCATDPNRVRRASRAPISARLTGGGCRVCERECVCVLMHWHTHTHRWLLLLLCRLGSVHPAVIGPLQKRREFGWICDADSLRVRMENPQKNSPLVRDLTRAFSHYNKHNVFLKKNLKETVSFFREIRQNHSNACSSTSALDSGECGVSIRQGVYS